jgi:hypothetical protein
MREHRYILFTKCPNLVETVTHGYYNWYKQLICTQTLPNPRQLRRYSILSAVREGHIRLVQLFYTTYNYPILNSTIQLASDQHHSQLAELLEILSECVPDTGSLVQTAS